MTREPYTNGPLELYILGDPVDWKDFDSWEKRWTMFVLDWVDNDRFIDESYQWFVMRKYEEARANDGKVKRKSA